MELPISLDLVIDRLNRLLSDLIFILATALQAEDLARSLAHSETIHGGLVQAPHSQSPLVKTPTVNTLPNCDGTAGEVANKTCRNGNSTPPSLA